jgi:uncharacterized membrane protein
MPPADPQSHASDGVSAAVRRNIESVAQLEQSFHRQRSTADRAVDYIVGFLGSTKFIVLHAVAVFVWLLLNTAGVPWIRKFDAFPFLLLSVCLSIEALFLSVFVLIKQNRMSRQQDLRAHLDLQINLLAEREMTLVLQMLNRISSRLGVRVSDEDVEELSEQTSVEAVAGQIQEKLPEE